MTKAFYEFIAHVVTNPFRGRNVAVLQVECHPYFQQEKLKERIKPYGTVLESWYPIGHGDTGLINEPVFARSTNPEHLRENFKIFDFSLTGSEMQEIGRPYCGKRFFTMNLAEQERHLGSFIPVD